MWLLAIWDCARCVCVFVCVRYCVPLTFADFKLRRRIECTAGWIPTFSSNWWIITGAKWLAFFYSFLFFVAFKFVRDCETRWTSLCVCMRSFHSYMRSFIHTFGALLRWRKICSILSLSHILNYIMHRRIPFLHYIVGTMEMFRNNWARTNTHDSFQIWACAYFVHLHTILCVIYINIAR